MLGGETQTLWARHTHHEMVANADKLGLHYAERVYQSHAFVLGSRAAAETFLHFLRDRHLVADGALAATQLRLLRKCFFLHPQPLPHGQFGSSLLTTTNSPGGQKGWVHAWSDNAQPAPAKPLRKKPIRKRQIQNLRVAAGAAGGKKQCGNGSSQADIARKISYLEKHQPSCRQAKKHGISYNLWSRVLQKKSRVLC